MKQQNIKNIFMFMFLLWGNFIVISHDYNNNTYLKEGKTISMILKEKFKEKEDECIASMFKDIIIIELKDNKISLKDLELKTISFDDYSSEGRLHFFNYDEKLRKYKDIFNFIVFHKINKIIQKDPSIFDHIQEGQNTFIDHQKKLQPYTVFPFFIKKYKQIHFSDDLFEILKEEEGYFKLKFTSFFEFIQNQKDRENLYKKPKLLKDIEDPFVVYNQTYDPNTKEVINQSIIYQETKKSPQELFEEYVKSLEQEMNKIIEEDEIKITREKGDFSYIPISAREKYKEEHSDILWEDQYEKKRIMGLDGCYALYHQTQIRIEAIKQPFFDESHTKYDPNKPQITSIVMEPQNNYHRTTEKSDYGTLIVLTTVIGVSIGTITTVSIGKSKSPSINIKSKPIKKTNQQTSILVN
jgi:hypothetical protein